MMKCERCKKELRDATFRMSMFNTQHICLDCLYEEKNHPQYEKARKAEHHQTFVLHNLNYDGIGLPEDLKKKYENIE